MERQWEGTTYGSGRMHRYLIRLLRYIDVRFFYLCADILIVPIVLLVSPVRNVSYRYFRKRHGYGRLKSFWSTYINHCRFSGVVIDKFAMYAGRKFKVLVPDVNLFENLAEKPESFVILSSHIGNYEIAGYSLKSPKKSINAIVYEFEKESVMANRGTMFEKTNVNMVVLRKDMNHLFEIISILDKGDIVSFPADRSMGGKVIECDFLGGRSEFPLGPFSVATMNGLDVLTINVMKTGLMEYTIHLKPLVYDKTTDRKSQIAQLSSLYVRELETLVRQFPTQWYNFFEFWK